MNGTLKRSKWMIAICLVVILVCGIVANCVKTRGGDYIVREVTISPYGSDLSFTMYIPKAAFDTDENGNFVNVYPAVIANEGFTEDRSCMNNVVLELVQRGFVVAQFDMYGHGRSESVDNKGYGNNPSPFATNCSLLGADDVRDYLYTQGYVDPYNIGMVGHSLGGSATAGMLGEFGGRFTLQDELLNALADDYGVEVTLEDVEAQDAMAVAERALDAEKLAEFKVRAELIREAYDKDIRSGMILDAGMNFMEPKVVTVAGYEVWRDVQGNIALVSNISGGTTKGINNPDFALTSDLSKTMLSQPESVKRETWYVTNLSATAEAVPSDELAPFYSDIADAAVQEAAAANRLRVLVQPGGWHAWTYMSDPTASAAAQFFATTLHYNNGYVADGASGVAKSTGKWKIQEAAAAIALFALVFMVYPLADVISELNFFKSMRRDPAEPVQDKKNPLVWIWAVIAVALPAITYTKGVGWGGSIQASWFSTVAVTTQTAVWALVMTLVLVALTVIKYFVYDKRALKVGFGELYGLGGGVVNFFKAIVLGLSVFGIVALILTLYYNLFGSAEMRATILAAFVFGKMAKHQYYSWLVYVVWFAPFYIFNAMLLVSCRMKNMSEKANTIIFAVINCLGMAALSVMQIPLGLYLNSAPMIPTIPGSSATIYNLPMLAFMLFVSTFINRKLYKKTGSALPGAFVNVMFFTIAAIRAYTYFVL
ncbi:MAG: prolyl oligopeptidase family serine peptidase [Clostridia bacterium]|nr:prolyl oligopeptidase family serine peptidase [Clostridia bacterium]